jgi:hypothetical protein
MPRLWLVQKTRGPVHCESCPILCGRPAPAGRSRLWRGGTTGRAAARPMRLEGDWRRDGFVVVRGLFSARHVQRLRDTAEACLTQWKKCNPETGQPTPRAENATCMRHLNHPGYFRAGSPELLTLLESIAKPELLALVEDCFGMPPLFRSTSLFANPLERSTEGSWHRDQQFLIPDEADERQYLEEQVRSGLTHAHGMQMQIALVPNDDVELVRGSHLRWDLPEEYAVRCADGRAHSTAEMPGAVRVELAAGDAVCFNSNGFHRGRYHVHRPRRTLMFTYTGASNPCFCATSLALSCCSLRGSPLQDWRSTPSTTSAISRGSWMTGTWVGSLRRRRRSSSASSTPSMAGSSASSKRWRRRHAWTRRWARRGNAGNRQRLTCATSRKRASRWKRWGSTLGS